MSTELERTDQALSKSPASRRPSQQPPPVEPVLIDWRRALVVAGCLTVIAVGIAIIGPHRHLLIGVAIAIATITVGQAVICTHINSRRELLARATNRLRATSSIALRATAGRWAKDVPTQLTLFYPTRLTNVTDPQLIAARVTAACSEIWPDTAWRTRRHSSRRGLIVIVRRPPPTPSDLTSLETADKNIRNLTAKLFGGHADIVGMERDDQQQTYRAFALEVSMDIALRFAIPAVQDKATRIISAVLPGQWRARYNLESRQFHFEHRPPLPRMLPRPILDCSPGTDLYYKLPQSVDEDGNMQTWDVSGVRAHFLKVGRTRTGKTVSLIGDAIESTRRSWRVIVLDPKRTEFLGLRGWPNVELVATVVPDQVAVIHMVLMEMEDRYRQIEEDGKSEQDFPRLVFIIDEYRQFWANVNAWYATIKVSGMPAKCPAFEEVGSLLRMAGAAGIHIDLGTQRPDAEFLGGESRDNFSGRASKGRLSPDGAQMMYDSQNIGTTVPLNIRGRGFMVSDTDDIAREVQDYYTPDPRKAKSPEDLQLLEQLRPTTTTWERKMVQYGDWDAHMDAALTAASEAEKDKKTDPDAAKQAKKALAALDRTSPEWWATQNATMVPFIDHGQDQRANAEAHALERQQATADPYADYRPARLTAAAELVSGDLIQIADDRWVCITATSQEVLDDEEDRVLISWTDDEGNEGAEDCSQESGYPTRRPKNHDSTAP